jgi:fructose transport system permease protein
MTDSPAGNPTQKQDFERVLGQASPTVASFDDEHASPLKRIQHFLHANPAAVPLIVLVTMTAFFAIAHFILTGESRFFSAYTLTLILQQVAVVGILGIAQTLIILTAGIDLSIGAIMVTSAVVMGNAAINYGLPAPIAIAMGMASGVAFGWLNGILVAKTKLTNITMLVVTVMLFALYSYMFYSRGWGMLALPAALATAAITTFILSLVARVEIPPFIVTLGTWSIVMAIMLIYSGNETVRDADIGETAPLLHWFAGRFNIGGAIFTYGVIAMVLLVVLFYYILNHTAWGRHVYAVGDEPDAAELSGVKTNTVLIQVYTLAGLIAGFAAWVMVGRNGSISPASVNTDFNLQSITAAVIGGISLFGGRGSILGTFFGAPIVGVMSMGLSMLGADPQVKVLVTGMLIIGAVVVDQWIRKVSG